MKKRHFLFDFDDVLFNTRKFRDDIIHLFSDYGVSKKVFYETYKDFPRKNKNGDIVMYDPEKQFRSLWHKYGLATDKLRRNFYRLVGNSRRYIFSDALKFLKKHSRENLYIISYGKNDLQKLKIKNSGISQYYRKIVILNQSKAQAIPLFFGKKNVENKEIYFFEDRVKFINEVKQDYPNIVTILMKRKEGRYHDRRSRYCDYVIKTFKDVNNFV